MHISLIPLIKTAGYAGIFTMVFVESGILLGVVFPGDTLLFTAGFLASQGYINIYVLIVGSFIAAVLGDSLGYWIGMKTGPKLFSREDSFFFKKAYVAKTQIFFEKYGKRTVFLARYIPVVRTFVPVFSGIGTMRYRTFLLYNILGGLAWTLTVPLIGYFLGQQIPNIDHYILPIIGLIFVVSFIPVVGQILRNRTR